MTRDSPVGRIGTTSCARGLGSDLLFTGFVFRGGLTGRVGSDDTRSQHCRDAGVIVID
ncbi:MAG: hypothetical protein RJA70_2541 [Pseudomonadota bacterium]|jgi:hypothetical protein